MGADPHRRHKRQGGERRAARVPLRHSPGHPLRAGLRAGPARPGGRAATDPAVRPHPVHGEFPHRLPDLCPGHLHVLYGSAPTDRVGEHTATAEWLAGWARREQDWGHNLLVLGDFNIDRAGDPLDQAFTSTGLTPPAELNIPRTIFDQPGRPHFYDQIAWFTEAGGVPQLSLAYTARAGTVDFPTP